MPIILSIAKHFRVLLSKDPAGKSAGCRRRRYGRSLGQLFVKEYFNENAKKRYTDLVEAIRDAYKGKNSEVNMDE